MGPEVFRNHESVRILLHAVKQVRSSKAALKLESERYKYKYSEKKVVLSLGL